MFTPSVEYSIKENALSLGFDLVGIANLESSKDALKLASNKYNTWLSEGHAMDMSYLLRHFEKKQNPSLLLDNAKSCVVVGMCYEFAEQPKPSKKKALVSLYTRQPDYHEVMDEKLRQLSSYIQKNHEATTFHFVDSKPVMDRFWAAQAGLGWIGKNSMLIHRKKGSFFFIGGVFTNILLKADSIETDHCGKCNQCIQSCPTDAILPNRTVASERCIAYHTIENKSLDFKNLPSKLLSKFGTWIAGCDVCQTVCPWNQKNLREKNKINRKDFLELNPAFNATLQELNIWTAEDFKKKLKKFAMYRMKFSGFKRNVENALKNS